MFQPWNKWAPLSGGGPRVRISFPPGPSQQRTVRLPVKPLWEQLGADAVIEYQAARIYARDRPDQIDKHRAGFRLSAAPS